MDVVNKYNVTPQINTLIINRRLH